MTLSVIGGRKWGQRASLDITAWFRILLTKDTKGAFKTANNSVFSDRSAANVLSLHTRCKYDRNEKLINHKCYLWKLLISGARQWRPMTMRKLHCGFVPEIPSAYGFIPGDWYFFPFTKRSVLQSIKIISRVKGSVILTDRFLMILGLKFSIRASSICWALSLFVSVQC